MIGIYKITNKINGKSYIGQSVHIQKRWEQHISLSKNTDNDTPLYRAIRKYGVNNFDFSVIEECLEEDLNNREIYWINFYNTYEDGYNASLGGGGLRKYNPQEVLAMYNQNFNINQTAKNLKMSYYTVRDILHNYEIFGKEEIKPVEKIDPKSLKVIKTYPSLGDAALDNNCSYTAIVNAASGKTNNCQGFFWRFVGDNKDFQGVKLGKQWKRSILQLDKDTGEIIEEYLSLTDAALALNKTPSSATPNIQAVCQGKRKSAYGYKWCYSEEVN